MDTDANNARTQDEIDQRRVELEQLQREGRQPTPTRARSRRLDAPPATSLRELFWDLDASVVAISAVVLMIVLALVVLAMELVWEL
jgi:hypothetical protein